MKQVFLAAALVLAGAGTSWAQSNAAQAEIKFDKETHDFGVIPQGVPVTTQFKVTNTGKAPLVITSVSSTGSVTPDWTKAPIKPGSSGYIKATFSAASPGDFTKSIIVNTNTERSQSVLYLKGSVKPMQEPMK
jgi:mannose-6-phosphate isomerase class I